MASDCDGGGVILFSVDSVIARGGCTTSATWTGRSDNLDRSRAVDSNCIFFFCSARVSGCHAFRQVSPCMRAHATRVCPWSHTRDAPLACACTSNSTALWSPPVGQFRRFAHVCGSLNGARSHSIHVRLACRYSHLLLRMLPLLAITPSYCICLAQRSSDGRRLSSHILSTIKCTYLDGRWWGCSSPKTPARIFAPLARHRPSRLHIRHHQLG